MLSKKHFILAGILLALMLGSAGALDLKGIGAMFGKAESPQCDLPAADLGWIPLSFVAILLGVMLTSFGWSISGVAGGTQKYMDYLRARLWDLVETAALLSIFSLAFAGLYEFGYKNIDTARTYSAIVRNTAAMDFSLVLGASVMITFIARQNPQIRLPNLHAFTLSFQLYPAFRPIFDGLGIMVQLISVAMLEWFAHEFLLCLIKVNMLTLLLPAGFFLRAFGLKNGGNALIGIALALYFVYPYLMMELGGMVTEHMKNEITSEPSILAACNSNPKPICCIAPYGMPKTPMPANWDEPFIPNGDKWNDPNWAVAQQDRISQKPVLEGDVDISFTSVYPSGAGPKYFCMFNTRLARSYGLFADLVIGSGAYSLAVGPGVQVLIGRLATWGNVNWVLLFLMPLITAFISTGMYETIFVLFVVSIVMPIFMIFITLTLAREIAKVLGTEIDLSALEKII